MPLPLCVSLARRNTHFTCYVRTARISHSCDVFFASLAPLSLLVYYIRIQLASAD